jgi:hypothetical protein
VSFFCNFSTLCIARRLKKKLKCGSHTSSSEGRATQLEEKQGHGGHFTWPRSLVPR